MNFVVQSADSTVPIADATVPVTDSGMTVVPPIVAAIAGAFVGAVATGLVAAIRGQRARRRELRALLLLIDAEVYGHMRLYESLQNKDLDGLFLDGLLFDASGLYTPRTEHWDESRGRLAQMLPVNHMKEIILYYKYLKDTVAATSPEGLAKHRLTSLAKDARRLLMQARAIRAEVKKYLKQLPSYEPEAYKSQQRRS